METIVDKLFSEHKSLIAYLDQQREISMKIFVEENFKKNFLLAIASLYEHQVTNILKNFTNKVSNGSQKLNSFVFNNAISRKYHTLFDWEATNANKFFSCFGDDFKNLMKRKSRESAEFERAVKAFLQLGQQRNVLVHVNFGEQFIEKTADELYDEYKLANSFIGVLEQELV
jgi:hypothetical protein